MKNLSELAFKLNVYADLDEARNYYEIIKKDFAHKKWSIYEGDKRLTKEAWYGFEELNYKLAPGGWALQSHLETDEVNCAPWIIDTYDPVLKNNNPMIFGFAEKLIKKIPMAKWLSISETPPGGGIVSHQDSHWHIHLPLYSPEKSYLTWDDENKLPIYYEHYPADGSIYAWNTMEPHSVVNSSNELRVHLFFKVEKEDVPNLFKITGKI
jgi:hypothetical protein